MADILELLSGYIGIVWLAHITPLWWFLLYYSIGLAFVKYKFEGGNIMSNSLYMPKSNVNLSPIEVVLQVDEHGMTTAKKLYRFLELNPGNYAKWCNCVENHQGAK